MTSPPGGDATALLQRRDDFDRLVDATEGVDGFCSSSEWLVPLHRCFGLGRLEVEFDGDAAVALAPLGVPGPPLWCGVDVVWGYASPVVGPDPVAGIALLERVLRRLAPSAAGVVVTGVARHGRFPALLNQRLGHRVAGTTLPVARHIARLDDGLDAYLSRRSRSFRRNARQAARRAEAAGLTVEWVHGGGTDVVDRAVRAERASWKGREGSGLADPAFARFYRELAAGPGADEGLRAGFARLGDRDVGFILGSVRGGAYRGLQLAFAEEARPLSVGNLLQLRQMARLVDEGVVRYDLGQDMAYKEAWSDERFVTDGVVLRT